MIISPRGRFVIATPTKCGTTTLESIAKRPQNVGKLEICGSDQERMEQIVAADPDGFKVTDLVRGLDTRRRQHRMAMPYGAESYRPYLLTRNPYSRWVSVYEYLLAPRNYSQWGARAVQGSQWGAPEERERSEYIDRDPLTFLQFLRWLRDMREAHPTKSKTRGKLRHSRAYRSPWVWLDSQVTSFAALESNSGQHVRLLPLEDLDGKLPRILKKRGVSDADLTVVVRNKTPHRPWQEYWGPKELKMSRKLGVPEECDVLEYEEMR